MSNLTFEDRQFLNGLRLEIRQAMAKALDDVFHRLNETIAYGSIAIFGEEFCDVYDHAPGTAVFPRNGHRDVDVPPYTTRRELREVAMDAFRSFESDWTGELYPGLLVPREIRIYDDEGKVADLYDNQSRTWFSESDDLISPDSWDETSANVKSLRDQASYEAAWDNFDTARTLRNEASRIEMRLKLSQQVAA